MTLQYIEQNVAHWLMQRDVLAFMVPSPEGRTRRPGSKATMDAYAQELDGLVLMGGSDVCPETYGEKALRPEWNGDRIRDDYEIALLRAFMALAEAGARRLPRRAGDQRRARRHALPGSRDAGAARAQSSQLGDLRAELPCDVVRPRQRPVAALSRHDARQDQLDPSSGREGARPRSRRRSVVGARSHRRGDPLHGSGVRVRRPVASGVPCAGRSFVHRRHADPRRIPRRRRAAQGRAAIRTIWSERPR